MTASRPSTHQPEAHSPSCQIPPRPQAIQALLSLAWLHPRAERPAWLRAELVNLPRIEVSSQVPFSWLTRRPDEAEDSWSG